MTECETKLTRVPSRASPITSWIAPTMKVRVSAYWTYAAVPGVASALKVENRTIDAAVVGPETSWRDDPNNAAMTAGIIAAYSPYSGGIPAMVANATPWGNTTMAPVTAASASARNVPRSTSGHHRRNGTKLRHSPRIIGARVEIHGDPSRAALYAACSARARDHRARTAATDESTPAAFQARRLISSNPADRASNSSLAPIAHMTEAAETAMIRAFQRLFASTVATAARAAQVEEREHGYHVATAALLVEMMRADYEVRPAERDAVLRALAAAFDDLSPEETRDLLARAEERADDATSLYEFTQLINRQLDHEQKAHVVELLWRVAYADGDLDKYEEHLVRRIADLIHVPHSVFIRMKHQARGEV